MITSVATFSAAQLRAVLKHGLPESHPFAGQRMFFIGFDSSDTDPSPLRESHAFDWGMVDRIIDWDPDGRHAAEHAAGLRPDLAPSIEHARAIVRVLSVAHSSPDAGVLVAQCQAGLWRSGAVAEFVRVEWGVPEADCSNRLVNVLTGGRWVGDRTFNVTLLRLLREAHAETLR